MDIPTKPISAAPNNQKADDIGMGLNSDNAVTSEPFVSTVSSDAALTCTDTRNSSEAKRIIFIFTIFTLYSFI
jgi:hypothetical protein